jgi:hypothetical protein
LFWGYALALLSLPAPVLDQGIRMLKGVLRSTPRFGRLYAGEHVEHP